MILWRQQYVAVPATEGQHLCAAHRMPWGPARRTQTLAAMLRVRRKERRRIRSQPKAAVPLQTRRRSRRRRNSSHGGDRRCGGRGTRRSLTTMGRCAVTAIAVERCDSCSLFHARRLLQRDFPCVMSCQFESQRVLSSNKRVGTAFAPVSLRSATAVGDP